jgi:hypothetical protein
MLIQGQLTACQTKNDDLSRQLQEAKSSKGGGAVVAAGAGAAAAEIASLKSDLSKVSDDRDKYKTDVSELEGKLKDAQSKGTGNPPPAGCTEGDKAKILYAAAENLVNKAPGASDKKERRGYYSSALEILHSSPMKSYADQQKLSDKIAEINKILNPVGNN